MEDILKIIKNFEKVLDHRCKKVIKDYISTWQFD